MPLPWEATLRATYSQWSTGVRARWRSLHLPFESESVLWGGGDQVIRSQLPKLSRFVPSCP